MNNLFKKLLWYSAPFVIFFIGFFLAFFLFPRHRATVPVCIGKQAAIACAELSDFGFSVRCSLVTVENPALAGVVVDQLPDSGALVYRGHNIHLNIGQQSTARIIPDFIGQPVSTVKALAKEQGYEVTLVWLHHYRPMGICFAQTPRAHEVAHHARIVCYCSLGSAPFGVMPNLIGQSRAAVEDFAQANNVDVQFIAPKGSSKSKNGGTLKVVDQQPASGTIVDANKQLFVQVQLVECD